MPFPGICSTTVLNVSDCSRELYRNVRPGLLTTICSMSILPATLSIGLSGLMVSGATGVADPINVFSRADLRGTAAASGAGAALIPASTHRGKDT